jgi:hypothetical protein
MSVLASRPWPALALALGLLVACGDDRSAGDGGSGDTSAATEDTGDGDGDPSTTGDGDPSTGDGDPSTTGDGDPSTTGDGDPSTGDGDPEPEFMVGVDVRSIDPTPQQLGSIYLGGFGAPYLRGTATGIHDSLYARSFAVGVGDEGVVFTVVDAIGMGNQWTRSIRKTASDLSGLPPERIIVATTHTHGGPDFQGLWGGVGSSYKTMVMAETVGSILAAWQTRQPADLSVSNSTADNNNRRGWEFTDDSIVVLQAHRQSDASLMGTMVTFAAHPVVVGASNRELTRDYCGYVVDTLEDITGAPVVFLNGILGDVSPKSPPGDYADDFEKAAAYGAHIGEQAALMIDAAQPVDVGLYADYVEWVMPVENTMFNLAGQLGILQYDFMQNGLSSSVLTQSAYVRLGTMVQIVAFPGESLTRNGLAVKEAMNAPFQAALGNAGDALGYFVPTDEWQIGLNDNYEESVSLGQGAGDATRDALLSMVDADPF